MIADGTKAAIDKSTMSCCTPARTVGFTCADSNLNACPPDEKRFVKQLRKDGKGFELVETDQRERLFAGGRKRNKKRVKAARKARKRNRR